MLDVMMPEHGRVQETCARLKASARAHQSAVIFLSALTESSDKVHGLGLGAVDFVNKPFQAEEVLARVRTHLTIRELQKQLHRRDEELGHELTVAQELLREALHRTDGVLLGESAAAERLDAESPKPRRPTTRCSSTVHRAATTKPSRGPFTISRRVHPARLFASTVSRSPTPRHRPSRQEGRQTCAANCVSPMEARSIWKAFSICAANGRRFSSRRSGDWRSRAPLLTRLRLTCVSSCRARETSTRRLRPATSFQSCCVHFGGRWTSSR